MFKLIKKWLGWHDVDSSDAAPRVQLQPVARARVAPARPVNKATASARPATKGRIGNRASGKASPDRPRAKASEADPMDKLSILDDDIMSDEIEPGLDPYNTGRFDRSKNWDKRFRN